MKWPEWAQLGSTVAIFGIMIALSTWYSRLGAGLSAQGVWVVDLALLLAFFLMVGEWRVGRPLGVLVSDRNLMSLSRLQMVLWTIVVLSGFFMLAMIRIHNGADDPLNIPLDKSLWAAMGISLASLVSTPLLLSQKKTKSRQTNRSSERKQC